MTTIAQVNASIQAAPLPATLQETGALISQGATNLSINTSAPLTQLSDLTPLLLGAKTLTAIAYSTGVVTATVGAGHGFPVGDVLLLTVAGVTPAGYNGTFLCTITSTTQFTYVSNIALGAELVLGVVTNEDVSELQAMAKTYFAQGSARAVYVLELGYGSSAQGIAALDAYITANPNSAYRPNLSGFYYAYLVPRFWADDTTFPAIVLKYNGTTTKTYLFITATLQNYPQFVVATNKDVFVEVKSPAIGKWAANVLTAAAYSAGLVTLTTTTAHGVLPGQWFQLSGNTPAAYNGWHLAVPGTTGSTIIYATPTDPGSNTILGTLVASYYANTGIDPTQEFSLAGEFYNLLAASPSNVSNVAPFAWRYLFGVTPFPALGMSALRATLEAANVNYIDDGSEGGITNTINNKGALQDGSDLLEWYAIDWTIINMQIALANTVINGSNNPLAPLYYDQPGIQQLQQRGQSVFNNGVSFGLLLNAVQPTVKAVAFNVYVEANPGDYRIGTYQGLSGTITPRRGFIKIVFNMVVTFFPTGNF